MSVSPLKKYIWLIETIQRGGDMSLRQINEKWRESILNEDGDDGIPRRTFISYKEAIFNLFGIRIVCKKGSKSTYHIENDGCNGASQARWLVDSFAIGNMLHESYELQGRILFEEVPSGHTYLTALMEAMHGNQVVIVDYQKFGEENPKSVRLKPYCLKVDKQRWYLLARTETEILKIYALDRMRNITITGETFEMPADFSGYDYFKDSVGVFKNPNDEVKLVRLKAVGPAVNYLRTLPIHPSQREVEVADRASVFELNVRIDFELKQAIFSYGAQIIVLAPRELQEEILATSQEIIAETRRAQKAQEGIR